MLTKLSTFNHSIMGDPTCRLFRQGSSIGRLAGDFIPEVQDWLSTYKSDREHVAVLVNALGGSEYWGQNRNGDNYYWDALQHVCSVEQPNRFPTQSLEHHPIDVYTGQRVPPYGYSTFLRAHPFVHHKNKDPNRAFGKVVLSCLNPKMKRVELVVLINRADALRFGAASFLDRLDKGEFPDVSMGCRTPYDICTICGHKSRTAKDYCHHITQLGMNYVMSDGRRVGVINPYPNFFDISFVFVGADRTAKAMAKFASGTPRSIIDAEELYGDLGSPPYRKDNPYAGTILWNGLRLNIECPKGTWRTGKTWTRRMKVHYGEIEGTKGVDGDPVDVYVGDNLSSPKVFVAHQNFTRGKDKGTYDEDKVMIGFDSIDQARKAYLDHYDSPDFLRSMTEMSIKTLKKMLQSPQAEKLAFANNQILPSGTSNIKDLQAKRHVSIPKGMLHGVPKSKKHHVLKKVLQDTIDLKNYKDKGVSSIDVSTKGPALWGLWNSGSAQVSMLDKDGNTIFEEETSDFPFSYGTADLSLHKNWLNSKHRVEYDSLYIKPKYRRRGIGSQIIKDAISASKALGLDNATLSASDEGVKVWPSSDIGAKFVDERKVHNLYEKWRKSNEGPELPIGSLSSAYPRDFISWLSDQNYGMFLKLQIPLVEKNASLNKYFSNASSANRRQRVWKSEDKVVKVTGSGIEKKAVLKTAELEKIIASDGVVGLVTKILNRAEPSLPKQVCECSSPADLSKLLSTTMGMGIVLHPNEFQRSYLGSLGEGFAANEFDRQGIQFESSLRPLESGFVHPQCYDQDLENSLLPILSKRSYARPMLVRRILCIRTAPSVPKQKIIFMQSPLLAKTASAYAWYQQQLAKKASNMSEQARKISPRLEGSLLDLSERDIFQKQASDVTSLGLAAATVPLVLLLSASARKNMEEGQDVSYLQKLIAENPHLASLGSAALAKLIMKDKLINKAVQDLIAQVAVSTLG